MCKQNSPEEEAELKKLKDIEKSVEQAAKKLEKVDVELTGLKNVSISFYDSYFVCINSYGSLMCLWLFFVGLPGQRPPGRGTE